jgi:hypothetical protein
VAYGGHSSRTRPRSPARRESFHTRSFHAEHDSSGAIMN